MSIEIHSFTTQFLIVSCAFYRASTIKEHSVCLLPLQKSTSSFAGYNGQSQWRQIDKLLNNNNTRSCRGLRPLSRGSTLRRNQLSLVNTFHDLPSFSSPRWTVYFTSFGRPSIVRASCRWTAKIISPIAELRRAETRLLSSRKWFV